MAALGRLPGPRSAAGALLVVVAFATVWTTTGPLQALLFGSTPSDAGGGEILLNRRLLAAAQRRQCPAVPLNGSDLSIAFLHIPKTAGTLLVESIRAMMPVEGAGRWCARGGKGADMPAIYAQCGPGGPAKGHLELLEAARTKFPGTCSGFATHNDITFFHEAGIDFSRTVSMVALRNPVERQISDFYYSLKARPDFMTKLGYAPKHDGDFAGLIKYAREVGKQHHVQQLAGAFQCAWPGSKPQRLQGQAMLEAAKRNLEQFCVIVIAEMMHESRARLAAAAGWDVSEFLRVSNELENKATGNKEQGGKVNGNAHPPVPLKVRRTLERVNALEVQLYDYALQLFFQHSL